MSGHLGSGMRGLALRLTAALEASGPLGDPLSKGELREEEVVDALRPHIPARYALVKGIVVTPDGRESDPQDIILADTHVMPPIFGRGNTKAVPVESVVGVIQVKSEASTREVRSAILNLASAKRLLPDATRYGFPVGGAHQPGPWETSASFFGGALFLSRRNKPDTLRNAFMRYVMELPARERCDALCVLDDFTIVWADREPTPAGVEFSFRAETAKAPMRITAGKDSVLYFYLSLAEHIANWITPPVQWVKYARDFHGHQFSYWKGED